MDQSTATPPMAPVDAGTDKSRAFARIDRLVESYGRANTRFGENPFAAAVEAALGAYGISAAQSPEQIARLRQADSLSAACGLANARTRAVTLRPDWYRSDHGHMVGVLTEPEGADVPVALIRETVGRYRLVRGDTGAAQRVTQAVAERVAVEALEIFPGFQPGMATIGGLARAILPSIRTELRWTAFIGALISLLAAGLPVATAFVIDVIIPGDERRLLIEIGVGLAIAALIMATLEVIRGRLLLRVDGVTSVVLQTAVWDHVLQLPAAVHRRYPSGDLQNRVDAVDTVRSTIISTVLTATLTAAFSVFYLALLFFYDARLAWFAVLFVLTLTLASIAISLYLRRFYRQQAELSGWLGGYVFQMLQAVVKLRGARAEGRALSRWADAYADWLALDLRTQRVSGLFGSLTALYAAAGLIAIYALSQVYSAGEISAGVFIAFLAAFGGFQGAFAGVSSMIVQWLSITPLWDRAKEILDEAPETDISDGDPGVLSGDIDVVNVSFSYDDSAPILKNVNIRIRPGEHVALVGPSGSGKSTLLRLLMGLETPDTGSIIFDNQDLQGLDPSRVRQQLGVVTQDGRIAAGSILENVQGVLNLSHAECMRACIAAGLERDLKQFPMGLHTVLTEGGATLSGGQRQRILVARALASQPRILIFDEATSALDNTTQAIVTDSVSAMHLTRITVAHRLSTVMPADKIYVLDEGRVVEEGAPRDLLAANGLFADLARKQQVQDVGS